jgi:hypothetical protein
VCPLVKECYFSLSFTRRLQVKYSLIFLFLLNVSSFSFLDEGLSHLCVPSKEIQCTTRALLCPPGYIDGCLTNESDYHQCLLKDEGPSCLIPMDLKCPTNFQDGCSLGQTDTHECVPVKGPSCEKKLRYSCPMGFEDACE